MCQESTGQTCKEYIPQIESVPVRQQMRFHVLALPHTVTSKEYNACFSPDTEIFTEDGWLNLKDVVESNYSGRFATLNTEKDVVEFQRAEKFHEYHYDGQLFCQESQHINFCVTPDHMIYCRTMADKRHGRPFGLCKARESKQVVQYRRDFPWQEASEVDSFVLPAYTNLNCKPRQARSFKMDDWLRLLGMYLSEGSVDGTRYETRGGSRKGCHVISIAQEKTHSQKKMALWLDNLGIRYHYDGRQFRICDVQLASWFDQFGKAREKYIPKQFKNLSKRQLDILLEALILGDGWQTQPTGCKRYVSYSLALANDVAEIATKIGYIVTQFDDKNPEVPRHIVTISERLGRPVVNCCVDRRNWLKYCGKVYCITVPNGLIYVRRSGKPVWMGNCAYSQKVLNLCKMLHRMGHVVYHYGTEGSEVECTEHITVVTKKIQEETYGNYDWKKEFFRHNANDLAHTTFNLCAIPEINKRKGQRDFLLCHWGYGHQAVANSVGNGMIVVEPGIGYECVFAPFKVFESYAWKHYIWGSQKVCQGSYYDAVIPNYFDPADFEIAEKEDYFCFLGRFISSKGLQIAIEATKRAGVKLKCAGQGDIRNAAGNANLDHVEVIGYVDVNERKRLLSKARGLFAPTIYIEPFGGVAVEAQMSGTPAITTDWGAFTETVLHGVTGYRCNTLEQFVYATKSIDNINTGACRQWAIQNYSLGAVARMYEEYFEQLYDLWDNGWYQERPNRNQLEWLRKWHPTEPY